MLNRHTDPTEVVEVTFVPETYCRDTATYSLSLSVFATIPTRMAIVERGFFRSSGVWKIFARQYSKPSLELNLMLYALHTYTKFY